MKTLNKIVRVGLFFFLILPLNKCIAQETEKSNLSVNLSYFTNNNKLPYIKVRVKTKVKGRFQPVSGIGFKLYLGEDASGALIGNVITNDIGEAYSNIPARLKDQWGTTLKHTFFASFDGSPKCNAATADLTASKARILIDTAPDRNVVISVQEMKDDVWVPCKDVELKVLVKRLGGDLLISEKQTFTTDSTGKVTAEFKRDSLPGDSKGNIILIAKVEDNDKYGNLSIEKAVPWGKNYKHIYTFGRRTLFATRGKSPVWLIFMAYSIMFSVWGVLSVLVYNLFTIKKLGRIEEFKN